ncbi:MAG: DoxX family protein [Gemmatimonadaceae bacterium]
MFLFKSGSTRQVNLALLVLRVVAGLTMAAHGYQKVFVYGFDGISAGFAGMGIPMASVAGPLVAVLELVGGVLVAVGVLTRPLALLIAFDMLVASTFVHLKDGFFAPKGVELTLLLLGAFLSIALAGAGSYSVDATLNRDNKQ